MNPPSSSGEDLISLRRKFHRHPEPGWREFKTTARIVEECRKIGVDEIYIGEDAIVSSERMGVPDQEEIDRWLDMAQSSGVSPDILRKMKSGTTGAVAVMKEGDGRTLGLRVDIDGLPVMESTSKDHIPAKKGFASEHDGFMHACGHDAHTTIGLGVMKRLKNMDFSGTLKVFFQPAEEGVRGGRAMAASDHLNDVDQLIGLHIGLGYSTGEFIAGARDFLSTNKYQVEISGTSSHAGKAPESGHNALLASSVAVQNLYAIPRHSNGSTRVNIGTLNAGTAMNVIPDEAEMKFEVRGETTELMEYMAKESERIIQSAAEMYGCTYDITMIGSALSVDSDDSSSVLHDIAKKHDEIDRPQRYDSFGASEDATYLMNRVQDNDGHASYVCIGSDLPSGHHTSLFDIDERSMRIGVDILCDSIVVFS